MSGTDFIGLTDAGAFDSASDTKSRLAKTSRRSLREAVRRALCTSGMDSVEQPASLPEVGASEFDCTSELGSVGGGSPDGQDGSSESGVHCDHSHRNQAPDGHVERVVFNRAACASLAEGEDPVDSERVVRPVHERFVLCSVGDIELARFALLEDAMAFARRRYGTDHTVVYALKSGVAMAYNSPGGDSVKSSISMFKRAE